MKRLLLAAIAALTIAGGPALAGPQLRSADGKSVTTVEQMFAIMMLDRVCRNNQFTREAMLSINHALTELPEAERKAALQNALEGVNYIVHTESKDRFCAMAADKMAQSIREFNEAVRSAGN